MKSLTPAAALDRLARFKELPAPLRAELHALCQLQLFGKGETVAVEGVHLDHLGFIAAGTLRVHSGPADDSAFVIGLLFEGDMYGRLFNGPLRYSLSTAEEAAVCVFRREPFEDLAMRWPELDRMVMQNMLDELDAAREWLMLLVPHRVAQRLAGFLLLLCKRWRNAVQLVRVEDGRLMLEIDVGRRDLAQLLGTRPESLTRAVQALGENGLIRSHSPFLFEVLDLERLMDFSGSAEIIEPAILAEMKGRLADGNRRD